MRISIDHLKIFKSIIMISLANILILLQVGYALGKCERLKTTLSYRQDNAPKDISAVVSNLLFTCWCP